jgi:hypothetical protein
MRAEHAQEKAPLLDDANLKNTSAGTAAANAGGSAGRAPQDQRGPTDS